MSTWHNRRGVGRIGLAVAAIGVLTAPRAAQQGLGQAGTAEITPYTGFAGRIQTTTADSTAAPLQNAQARQGSPNIIYLVLDDVGFADLGAYGSEIPTPNIDALATAGLRYNSFHTHAICSTTRAALLTGRVAHAVGMKGILLPPLVQWGNRIANPPPQNLLNSFYNTSLVEDFSASLTIVKGHHTIKAGLFRLKQFQAQITGGAGNAIGTLSFSQDTPGANPFDTSFGFANAAIGTFGSYSQNSVFSEYSSDIRNLDFYAQDNWKVNSKLTLDYGLRFVHQVPEHDKFLRASNFLPENWTVGTAPLLYVPGCVDGANPCTGTNRQAMNPSNGQLLGPTSAAAIGTVIAGTGNALNGLYQLGDGIVETGYNWPAVAIAPRFGAAYDPTGNQRIVLRGSAGLFFDRTAANATRAAGSNPPVSDSATLRYGKLQSLATGLSIKGAPTLGGAWVYDSPDLPSSLQWNTGAQVALPYAMALDLSYVGQHAYAQAVSANINAVDFGAAFLPQNQDPTLAASATPGASALSSDLLRAMRGYGTITQNQQTAWRTFHSLQFSVNRRFQNGLSFGFNDTWSLYDHQSTAPRFDHGADRMAVLRADQAQADELLGTAVGQVHLMRGNFVWDLPDIRSTTGAMKGLFNAPNAGAITGVQNTMNLNSPQTPTAITNLPYDTSGNLIDSRSRPRGAGFGVANVFQAPRTIQLQLRFAF